MIRHAIWLMLWAAPALAQVPHDHAAHSSPTAADASSLDPLRDAGVPAANYDGSWWEYAREVPAR